MSVGPLVRFDHRESVDSANAVEMVDLPGHWFKINVCFVDQFVPVEVLDGCDVFLPHLDQLLLQVTLDLTNAARLEGREVVGYDPGTQGRDRVGHKGALVERGFSRQFLHLLVHQSDRGMEMGKQDFEFESWLDAATKKAGPSGPALPHEVIGSGIRIPLEP